MRDWLLVFHILGAAGWIGGGLYAWFSYSALARSAPDVRAGALTTVSERADRFFGPTAGLTLLTGVGLVLTEAAWGWTDTFVLLGIGMFVFSALWQPLVASKNEERLLAAVSGDGGDLDDALAAFNRSNAVEMAAILVVLWSMVFKLGA